VSEDGPILAPAGEQTPMRRALTSLRLHAADLADTVSGRRDRLTPPRRLSLYVGHGDFRATGDEFLALFRDLGGLREEDRVLDIGCGIGRMARALVDVLAPPGSYDGFDVARTGIDWCRERYVGLQVPFRFEPADVRNAVYNPSGRSDADTFRFPYEDSSFEFAFATSVFTHLLPGAADRYLAEAGRVLAPGGRLFATWFAFEGPVGAQFTVDERFSPAAIADAGAPESAVAYPAEWLRERLGAHGFTLRAIHPGTWRGGPGATMQDVVVAVRE